MTSPTSADIAETEAEIRVHKQLARFHRKAAQQARERLRRFVESADITVIRVPAEPTEAEHHE